jgi:hypothetical protein
MSGNLIFNGSFEETSPGEFKENGGASYGVMLLNAGDPLPRGWEVAVGPIWWIASGWKLNGTSGPPAAQGSLFINLTNEGQGLGAVETKDPIPTHAGRRYHLSLSIGSFESYTGWEAPVVVSVTAIDASGSAGPFFTQNLRHDAGSNWSRHGVVFVAYSDKTRIRIVRVDNNSDRADKNIGASHYVGVDDVRVIEAQWTILQIIAALWRPQTWLDVLRTVQKWFVRGG